MMWQPQILEGMEEYTHAMLQVAMQVTEVGEGIVELLREVILVVAIEESTMREVICMGEQTILQPKWSRP